MQETYPEGYLEKKWNKKTKWQKHKHSIRVFYKNNGIIGVLRYFRALMYISFIMLYAKYFKKHK